MKSWIIRAHVAGICTKPITPKVPPTPDMLISTTLPVRGYDILSAYPVHSLPLKGAMIKVAVFGLLGKMTGACAIIGSDIGTTENGQRLRMNVALKALGTLGIWVSDMMERSVDEDMMVMVSGKVVPRERVKVMPTDKGLPEGEEKSKAGVLEIDVQGAWKDLKLEAGWSNEVRVEVWIS